jgi:hypothetical protein
MLSELGDLSKDTAGLTWKRDVIRLSRSACQVWDVQVEISEGEFAHVFNWGLCVCRHQERQPADRSFSSSPSS